MVPSQMFKALRRPLCTISVLKDRETANEAPMKLISESVAKKRYFLKEEEIQTLDTYKKPNRRTTFYNEEDLKRLSAKINASDPTISESKLKKMYGLSEKELTELSPVRLRRKDGRNVSHRAYLVADVEFVFPTVGKRKLPASLSEEQRRLFRESTYLSVSKKRELLKRDINVILSVDIGFKNLASCQIHCKSGQIHSGSESSMNEYSLNHWKIHSVFLPEAFEPAAYIDAVKEFVKELPESDVFVLERQLFTRSSLLSAYTAFKMIVIETLIVRELSDMYGKDRVFSLNPKVPSIYFGFTKDHKAKKRDATNYVLKLLDSESYENRKIVNIEDAGNVFHLAKKKDDLCDAFLQGREICLCSEC
eukprot:Nk52_evm13s215 gene=Nk52_evmTU13s215